MLLLHHRSPSSPAVASKRRSLKWSKGKQNEKVNNMVVLDQATVVEASKFKLTTPSVLFDRNKYKKRITLPGLCANLPTAKGLKISVFVDCIFVFRPHFDQNFKRTGNLDKSFEVNLSGTPKIAKSEKPTDSENKDGSMAAGHRRKSSTISQKLQLTEYIGGMDFVTNGASV